MIGAAGLLAVLDGVILSEAPDLSRIALALVVTAIVGGAIAATWRSNVKIEKAAANTEKNAKGGGKAPLGGRPTTKR